MRKERKQSLDSGIDIVILWVDGNDSKWLAEKNKYLNFDNEFCDSGAGNRFRDWGLLKYWFRSIEKNMPWVRKIHFVTYGHIPEWLNVNHPKLHIVRHEDFIPIEYLPTFNSNVIQYYLDRIDGISDKFILFDDDVFVLRPVSPSDFFDGNKIKEVYSESPIFIPGSIDVYPHSILNNLEYVNKYYNKRKFYKKHLFKCLNPKLGFKNVLSTMFSQRWSHFVGFYSNHICQAYTKKGYNLFWKYCGAQLRECSSNRFRGMTDLTTYLVRQFLILEGDFSLQRHSFGHRFELGENNQHIFDSIKKKKYSVVCINDSSLDIDFENTKKDLTDAFDLILNERSEYEK